MERHGAACREGPRGLSNVSSCSTSDGRAITVRGGSIEMQPSVQDVGPGMERKHSPGEHAASIWDPQRIFSPQGSV